MKNIITIAAIIIAGISSAQTEPLANAKSYSDSTAKPQQSILKVTYPPLKPISPAATPTVDLNLPKASVVKGMIIIGMPHRRKDGHSPNSD